jgi:hypothetical protein
VYVGYTGETPKTHAGRVFPGLVRTLLEHGLDNELDSLAAVAAGCLDMIRSQHPEDKSLRGWTASVLPPVQQLPA